MDAHSAAMLSRYWTRPRWIYRYLARSAAATIVTNEYFANTVRGYGGRALVIPDIPMSFAVMEYRHRERISASWSSARFRPMSRLAR